MAGGAPRDWDVGQEAVDVDLWVTYDSGMQTAIPRMLAAFQCTTILTKFDPSKYIQAIYDVNVRGTIIQVIFVTDDSPSEVIGRFCCNLSEAIWDYVKDVILVSPDYVRGRKEKVILFCTDQTGPRAPTETYLGKMQGKFPDYTFHYFSEYQTVEDMFDD